LAVKRSKCAFGTTSVAYMGHVISGQGVTMDAEKIKAIKAWLPPRTVHIVCGFLGLTSYYRKFIHSYGDITTPLTPILKCDMFSWTSAAVAAFHSLKAALTTAQVLQLPDFNRAFIVDCNASAWA
jgi:hypothetical protein